jgi:hypothetical protein
MNIDHDKSSSHIGVFQNRSRLISRNARLNAFGFGGLAPKLWHTFQPRINEKIQGQAVPGFGGDCLVIQRAKTD